MKYRTLKNPIGKGTISTKKIRDAVKKINEKRNNGVKKDPCKAALHKENL